MIEGLVQPGFEGVRDVFSANFDAGEELGAAFAVWQNDELVVDLRGGFADRSKTKPWSEDTIVPVYSTTKPISALVVARAIERSASVDWETPLAEIWPEFAAGGKGALTIAEVISHQGGLSGFVEPIDPGLWLDPPALSARLAEEKPIWEPDGTSGYHPLTWGYLAGEIVQRLEGKSLGTCLREWITHAGDERIDFAIGLPANEHERAADIKRPTALPEIGEMNEAKRAAFFTKWAAPDRGGAIWREIEIPSANGHGNAVSTARLYSAFVDGKIGGREIISEETYHTLTQQRSLGPDRVLPFEIEFAAGVMRNNAGFYGPNENALGHSGWGGSAALGDPDTGISCAYVMNKQSNILQGDPRAQRLFNAVYDAL